MNMARLTDTHFATFCMCENCMRNCVREFATLSRRIGTGTGLPPAGITGSYLGALSFFTLESCMLFMLRMCIWSCNAKFSLDLPRPEGDFIFLSPKMEEEDGFRFLLSRMIRNAVGKCVCNYAIDNVRGNTVWEMARSKFRELPTNARYWLIAAGIAPAFVTSKSFQFDQTNATFEPHLSYIWFQ